MNLINMSLETFTVVHKMLPIFLYKRNLNLIRCNLYNILPKLTNKQCYFLLELFVCIYELNRYQTVLTLIFIKIITVTLWKCRSISDHLDQSVRPLYSHKTPHSNYNQLKQLYVF